MNALAWIVPGTYLLVAQALASSCGLLLMKSGLTGDPLVSSAASLQLLASARFLIGSSLYVFSFAAWIGVLASMPLSTAYPLAIGLTMTCSTLGATVMLGEQLDTAKLAGVVCVFLAVVLLTVGSRR
jgi:multidrug transporter EmrE-like cation transporter